MSSPAAFHEGQSLPEYRVRAHNAAIHSTNKIHDDTVAKQYGFAGGLVPGVTVFAYMARPIVEALGPDWLARGQLDARFLKPFYEGEFATVRTRVRELAPSGPIFELEAVNESGEPCAVGSARWITAQEAHIDPSQVPAAELQAERPPASEEWFRANPVLGSLRETWQAGDANSAFLAEIADSLPLWHEAGAPAHPGYLVRKANDVLSRNVVLGPWIHVSSDVHYLGLVHDGDELVTRGRVLDVFERKGHRFVDLDVLILRNGAEPVMRAQHTAIYEPRKVS
ncbi:MAG: MaoC family dehydratase [Dehalococcoidia bacterium]|nr:MaoC family dehydratase [Dehalococcoidia bacterium]